MTQFDPEGFRDHAEFERFSKLVLEIDQHDLELHDPPPEIWQSLAARVAADRAPAPIVNDAPPIVADIPPVVVDINSRRRRPFLLAAAAVAVVVAGVGAFVAVREGAPTERLVASAQLKQLEDLGDTAASAQLVRKGDQARLVIDASNMAPPPEGSEYELWLIDRGVTNPRSLGVVTGSETVDVPSSIDPDKFPIVDISLEPIDGNHKHSGHSLMRGTLQ